MLMAKSQNYQFQEETKNQDQQGEKQQQPKQEVRVVERKPTDKICCYIFVGMQVIQVVIALYALIFGDPERLAQPYDPDHIACGVNSNAKDYPFIYFATPDEQYLYRTVCVKHCPNAQTQKLDCLVNSVVKSCQIKPNVIDVGNSILAYNTVEYDSVCLPTTQYYYSPLQYHLFPGTYQAAGLELNEVKWWMLLSIVITFLISFILVLIIEKAAKCIVWLLIMFFVVIVFSGSFLSFLKYENLSNPPSLPKEDTAQVSPQSLIANTDARNSQPEIFLLISIVLFLFGILAMVSALLFRRRIQLATEILRVSGDFVKANKQIIILPLVIFGCGLTYEFLWLIAGLNLYSTMPVTTEAHQLPYDQVYMSMSLRIMIILFYVSLFWTLSFLIGAAEFLISGAVCNWQNIQGMDKKQSEVNLLSESWYNLKTYNFGSVALGSLLIAMLSPFSFCYEYGYKQNKVVGFLCCCILACKSFLHQITVYAYVFINLYGHDFMASGKEAALEIDQSTKTFLVAGGLGETFVLIGRVFNGAISAFIVFLIGKGSMSFIPCIVCFFFSFTTASVFMAIYGISAEAIIMVYMHYKRTNKDVQCTKTLETFLKDIDA